MTEPVPTFWPAMVRCDRCGQFMKRGLISWVDHLEICRGKSKPPPDPQLRLWYVPPSLHKALEKASKEYFENSLT